MYVMGGIVDLVKQSLSTARTTLTWNPVSRRGLDIAWVGMQVPEIDTGGRPWVWEVVTPRDFDAHGLGDDPMVLPVVQDTVVITVNHSDHSGPIVRMQVPVSDVPDGLEVDGHIVPGKPWSFVMETGWTTQALGHAAQAWIDREVGSPVRLDPHECPDPQASSFQFSPRIAIESAAFDKLLTLAPHEAAVVSSALGHIHDALQPYR